MNTYRISEYLQFLRKEHGYTQEALAGRLHLSRQAVSKWETGHTIPDLEALLEISRLYGVTINDLLEPPIPSDKIEDFEDLTKIGGTRLREILREFETGDLVTASMGASPEINEYLQNVCTDIDWKAEQYRMGRVRVEEIEERQRQIVERINR